jgi:hypothetical protein
MIPPRTFRVSLAPPTGGRWVHTHIKATDLTPGVELYAAARLKLALSEEWLAASYRAVD